MDSSHNFGQALPGDPVERLPLCPSVFMLTNRAIRTVALFSVLLLEFCAYWEGRGGGREQGSSQALGMVFFQVCSQPQPFPQRLTGGPHVTGSLEEEPGQSRGA